MKYLITERQLKLIKEDKVRWINFEIFNNDWDLLQKFLERRGNPQYIIAGDLDLQGVYVVTLGSLVGVDGDLNLGYNKIIEDLGNLQYIKGDLNLQYTNITSLGNLKSIGGDLDLYLSNIKSLGDLESVGRSLILIKNKAILSLGNLKSVGENLSLYDSSIISLGNLQYVGGDLDLYSTPLSRTTTIEEIRNQVDVGGNIYLDSYL